MTGRRAFVIRDATEADGPALLALLPRLADFDIPAHRDPRHLWQDDEALLRRWLAGEAEDCLVQLAAERESVLGLSLTTLRPEPLSHEPAAHLEALAVAAGAEGRGIGMALLEAAEANATAHGARSADAARGAGDEDFAVSEGLHALTAHRRGLM